MRNILKRKITRNDLEIKVLNKSLVGEYAKLGGMDAARAIESTPKDSLLKAKMITPKAITPKTEVKKAISDTTKKN